MTAFFCRVLEDHCGQCAPLAHGLWWAEDTKRFMSGYARANRRIGTPQPNCESWSELAPILRGAGNSKAPCTPFEVKTPRLSLQPWWSIIQRSAYSAEGFKSVASLKVSMLAQKPSTITNSTVFRNQNLHEKARSIALLCLYVLEKFPFLKIKNPHIDPHVTCYGDLRARLLFLFQRNKVIATVVATPKEAGDLVLLVKMTKLWGKRQVG